MEGIMSKKMAVVLGVATETASVMAVATAARIRCWSGLHNLAGEARLRRRPRSQRPASWAPAEEMITPVGMATIRIWRGPLLTEKT
jgi:hypothetical protein